MLDMYQIVLRQVSLWPQVWIYVMSMEGKDILSDSTYQLVEKNWSHSYSKRITLERAWNDDYYTTVWAQDMLESSAKFFEILFPKRTKTESLCFSVLRVRYAQSYVARAHCKTREINNSKSSSVPEHSNKLLLMRSSYPLSQIIGLELRSNRVLRTWCANH